MRLNLSKLEANVPELSKELNGSVGIVIRGGNVSFAYKASACARAGCIGVRIVQTYDVWPFTPSGDTSSSEGLNIPVVAMRSATGKRLISYLKDASKNPLALDARIRVSMKLKADKRDFLCIICHDEVTELPNEDESIIQLPCLHYFHESCILAWLKNNNTCPTCRYQLETEYGIPEKPIEAASLISGWYG